MKKPTVNSLHKGKNMRCRMLIIFFGAPLYLSGCSQDYSLDPPVNSEKITVTVKLPKELKTETMWVMYRSSKCKRISRGASGQRTEQDGHQSVYKELERQGLSDLYQVELPKDGGGACKWNLANVTFGVALSNPLAYGENLRYGIGGGVVVVFDHNNSPRGGKGVKIDGDLSIRKDYYPWISELPFGGGGHGLNLLSEDDSHMLEYQALKAKRVYFEPVLHSEFIVRGVWPKKTDPDKLVHYTYSDGSAESVKRTTPDFYKLQTIRTGRARDCFIPQLYAKCPDRRPQLVPDWLPDPEKPGYGRYLIVDEWGRELPLYNYRLIGQNGKVILNRTNIYGLTQPMPKSLHPLTSVEFPERTSAFP